MLEQWSEIFQNTPANGPPSLGADRNLISQLSGKVDSLSPEIQKVLVSRYYRVSQASHIVRRPTNFPTRLLSDMRHLVLGNPQSTPAQGVVKSRNKTSCVESSALSVCRSAVNPPISIPSRSYMYKCMYVPRRREARSCKHQDREARQSPHDLTIQRNAVR